jgi:hypothetical protein
MSDLFEDKSPMPGNANVTMASNDLPSDKPVLVIQTMQERRSDRADAAMSVRNLSRPRRGHDY